MYVKISKQGIVHMDGNSVITGKFFCVQIKDLNCKLIV